MKNDDEKFYLQAPFEPSGDQPQAISNLLNGLDKKQHSQTLLGATGTGKTFTMAQVIAKTNRPTIIMAPNKTLAAQLYGEMKEFFPNNHVEYFVSYYDYYQPEAYVPKSDLYIEKDSAINEQIDRMRHSATRALLEHRDTIVIASVSCIYGLGDPSTYEEMRTEISINDTRGRDVLIKELVDLQYSRNDINFVRGSFRVKGDILDIFPSHLESRAWKLSFWGDEVEKITEFDPLTGQKFQELQSISVFPNSHYATPMATLHQAIDNIKKELADRLDFYRKAVRPLEEQRLRERTHFDIEMMETTGHCKSIENYSRHLTGRKAGDPPPTLFEYLPKDALLFIDESHVSVPQINGMYKADKSRKENLSEYGFRLPSCKDNRPLKFEEWDKLRPDTIFVSATPGDWELEQSNQTFAEQIIRPTGLLDPVCEVKPATNQVDDLMHEVKETIKNKGRVLCTTLTKKMAEQLTEYLHENGIKVKYMHSDIDTLERIEIIRELRKGIIDVLVGINLLREGLDIPECKLVAILDADKEGFLRSTRSLIQTIGRAARNSESKVILYADKMTKSMTAALNETSRRREKQIAYNKKHGIIATTIKKEIADIIELEKTANTSNRGKSRLKQNSHFDQFQPENIYKVAEDIKSFGSKKEVQKQIIKLEKQMHQFADNLDFEKAAELRDRIKVLENELLILG